MRSGADPDGLGVEPSRVDVQLNTDDATLSRRYIYGVCFAVQWSKTL